MRRRHDVRSVIQVCQRNCLPAGCLMLYLGSAACLFEQCSVWTLSAGEQATQPIKAQIRATD
jgi:hypothetical protein